MIFSKKAENNETQLKVAREFLDLLYTGNYDLCWKKFDKKNNPNVNKKNFIESLKAIKKIKTSETQKIEFSNTYIKLLNNKLLVYYSFKLEEKNINNDIKPIIIEVVFINNKTLKICGVFYKWLIMHVPNKKE